MGRKIRLFPKLSRDLERRKDPTRLAKFVSSHTLDMSNQMTQAVLTINVCLYVFVGPQRGLCSALWK